MSTQTETRPAGWHPYAGGGRIEAYWNGHNWTAYRMPLRDSAPVPEQRPAL